METPVDRYGAVADPADYHLHHSESGSDPHEVDGLIREEDGLHVEDEEDDEEPMTMEELLYSSSSFYAIAKPVALTMILAAWTVVHVNNDATRAQGEQAMSDAYEVWQPTGSGGGEALAVSLANALVMVSVICCMTFLIVILYRFKFMKCLIGYMILSSGTLLGILGGNLVQVALHIYGIPLDKGSFAIFMYNFAIVGVLAVFFGQGVPKYVTQGYLIATSVILAWHLAYFDAWTTWALLFMLALYDLCAVLTPCGPLKALVELMSQEGSPEMPGLLFGAELPKEAKRPGVPRNTSSAPGTPSSQAPPTPTTPSTTQDPLAAEDDKPLTVDIPLAIAKVYSLTVVGIPAASQRVMYPENSDASPVAAAPLLQSEDPVELPENPNAEQLQAIVTVKLPTQGGRLEQVARRGKKVYLERDRHGIPKRLLWVDRKGKVFAEMKDSDEEGPERNSIRLGLGDFIFYSVLVSKAAQYSFSTFAACLLVILAGLGGTLVLLSVYHHALPALPISIFLGVIFYLLTRLTVEPWIEAVLSKPYYV